MAAIIATGVINTAGSNVSDEQLDSWCAVLLWKLLAVQPDGEDPEEPEYQAEKTGNDLYSVQMLLS